MRDAGKSFQKKKKITEKRKYVPEDLILRKHWLPSAHTLLPDHMNNSHSSADTPWSQALLQLKSKEKDRGKS